MCVAGPVPEAMLGVWSGWIRVADESVLEYLRPDFGGNDGKQWGVDLRINVVVTRDFDNCSGLRCVLV